MGIRCQKNYAGKHIAFSELLCNSQSVRTAKLKIKHDYIVIILGIQKLFTAFKFININNYTIFLCICQKQLF